MVCMIHVLLGKSLWINLHLGYLLCFISNDKIDMIFVLCLRNSEYITVYILYNLQHVFVSTHPEGTLSK